MSDLLIVYISSMYDTHHSLLGRSSKVLMATGFVCGNH